MSVPPRLQAIIAEFQAAPKALRLQLLLEYANRVPPPPDSFRRGREMERVDECQTPLHLATEFLGDGSVQLHFDAPADAPTTRGFAGILSCGLSGLPKGDILAVDDDFYVDMGLAEVISPLRLRGMSAMVARIKRQVREHEQAEPGGGR